LKVNYYNNINFDKKSFFFITHRSEVAGCVYLNAMTNTENEDEINYCIEYLLVNKKHTNKGVEKGLVGLAIKRAKEKNVTNGIFLDISTFDADEKAMEEILDF
jgi:hypothetical protein